MCGPLALILNSLIIRYKHTYLIYFFSISVLHLLACQYTVVLSSYISIPYSYKYIKYRSHTLDYTVNVLYVLVASNCKRKSWFIFIIPFVATQFTEHNTFMLLLVHVSILVLSRANPVIHAPYKHFFTLMRPFPENEQNKIIGKGHLSLLLLSPFPQWTMPR